MARFNLFRKRPKDEVAPPSQSSEAKNLQPELDDPLLTALIRNEAIDREKAMMIPAVSSAVDFIASSIASMPVKLCRRKHGRVEVIEKDSRVRILNGDTGDVLNKNQLFRAMIEDYLLDKGGFAYVRRELNEVTGIFYVKPIYVIPYKNIDLGLDPFTSQH